MLSEPLTARELEVMFLIADGYSNQEIADRLYIALSTVKGYIQNIYGKLEVRRRTEAVQKARQLGLV
jgi:LuxR family maltose regulon positive regulatory protein